ncbi:MAG: hypothetical protein HY722_10565 [Planctomycetes bacterium]|nr:hypothetical protein [Planctomycetota bacterium]
MTAAETLDEAVDLYRGRPGLVFGLTVAADAPLAASVALLVFLPELWPGGDLGYRRAVHVLALGLAVAAAARFVVGGAVAEAVAGMAGGARPDGPRCLRAALARSPVLVASGFLSWLAVAAGAALAVAPGLLVAALAALLAPVAVLEGGALTPTLRRGLGLAWGAYPRLLAHALFLLMAWAVVSIDLMLGASAAIYLAGAGLHLELGSLDQWASPGNLRWLLAVGLVVFLLLDPFLWTVRALVYLETRARHEGLDLLDRVRQVREAASTGETGASAAPLPGEAG